ncbi:hypothetical protein Ciccas_012167 [Cichlidogyrus casuarinus]|uniref:Uncharacterized protein n=1 Tax=Cichlidogyrus casuarinus TaxID=1844966 RepID=A0ABD2PP72_9PLAT
MDITELPFYTSSFSNTEKCFLFMSFLRHILWSSNQFDDHLILDKHKYKTFLELQTQKLTHTEHIAHDKYLDMKKFLLSLTMQPSFTSATTKLTPTKFHIMVHFQKTFKSTWFHPKIQFKLSRTTPIHVFRPIPNADNTMDIEAPPSVNFDFLYQPEQDCIWYSSPVIIQGS